MINILGGTPVELEIISSFAQRHAAFSTEKLYEFFIEESLDLGPEDSLISTKLSNTGGQFWIARSTQQGLRYSLNLVLRSLINDISQTEVNYQPQFKIRGVIEGFYGTPWAHQQRKQGIAHFADFGMNRFMLAPKDDPWQRYDWKTPFNSEFIAELSELVEIGMINAIELAVAVSPGLSVCYSSPTDVTAIMVRFKQLHEIGIRSFGLFLDDIPVRLQNQEDIRKFDSIMQAHSHFCNSVWAELQKMDPESSLAICPLHYHGKGTEEYITVFGSALDLDLQLMWTGRQICSEYLDVADAAVFI
jgi:hypothetical protein